MASISTGGDGPSGKKAVDADIPLIPFIDLLLCCVMFLLVTAVWNELSSLEAQLPAPMGGDRDAPSETLPLTLRVEHGGYHLVGGVGDETRIPLAAEGRWDTSALRAHLAHRRRLAPGEERVIVTADDGVEYAQMIGAIDALAGNGYARVTIGAEP